MREQHLSDEAIAAFADDVLRGHARERAGRHTSRCAECKHAVAVQREAIWALRAAPAPALPSSLLDRLRDVPATTPINTVPTRIGPDGSTMFAAFGSLSAAALVPQESERKRGRSIRPFAMTTAALAVASTLALTGASHLSADPGPAAPVPAHTQPSTPDSPIRLAHLVGHAPTR